MKYVLLIMILLVGCSVIEGDKPTFAKGAATALVEQYMADNYTDIKQLAVEAGRTFPFRGDIRKTGELTLEQAQSSFSCEGIFSYLFTNNSRGEISVKVTPTAEQQMMRYGLSVNFSSINEYFIPHYLEPIVIEGLFEEYVGEGVWRVELKGNFLEIYEKHGGSSEFEPYVWEVYEPLGNIRRISKEFKEYC